jgi:programmed cell death 8 (apoptosis-inducing factor)
MFWSDLGPVVGFEGIGLVDAKLPTIGVFAKQTPEDTPLADTSDKLQAGGATKAASTLKPPVCGPDNPKCAEDYSKGVVFYLKDEKVVGVLLWNVFNRISTARKIIAMNAKPDDLTELAKWFKLHGSSDEE